jgi:hypothetical protein
MPRWMIIALLTLFVTFVTSSVKLRLKHVRSSPDQTFWDDGTRWRDLTKGSAARVRFNRDRLVADLKVLPFAFVAVLVLVFIYDLISPFFPPS